MTEKPSQSNPGCEIIDSKSGTDAQSVLRKRAEERHKAATSVPDKMHPEELRHLIHELQVHQIELEMQNDELRRTQAELEASHSRYVDLFDFSPVGFLTLEEHGVILDANLTAAGEFGVPRSRLINIPFSAYVAIDDADTFYLHLKAALNSGVRETCRVRLRRNDGGLFWVRLETILHADSAVGRICRVAVIDISDRKRAEEALHESEALYSAVVETAKEGVAIIQDKVFVFVNRAMAEMHGYSAGEMMGKPFIGFVAPQYRDDVMQRHCARLGGKMPRPANHEVKTLYKDGSELDMEVSATLLQYKNKPGVLCVFRNVTERKRMEAELLKVQKLESVGLLAGGIAHDYNNILMAIMGNIFLAKMYAKSDEKILRRLTEAEAASERARDLTRQLYTFSRGGFPVKKLASVANLLRDTVSFSLTGSNTRCEYSIPDDLWAAEIDQGQISQVISNMTINARQASRENGVIKAYAQNCIVNEQSRLPLTDGKYVKFSIEDHGPGIPAENFNKVFDLYYSTKKKGSGLGLAIALSIVKKHSGHIAVESQPGVRTVFSVYLPASAQELAVEVKKPAEEMFPGKGRVLVMDDMEEIRDVTCAMLLHLGYEAESASCGSEAIKLYKKAKDSGAPFNVVLLDLTIPGGMGGLQALQELVKIDPDVVAVVASGYSDDPVMASYQDHGFKGMVVKPYEMEQLGKVLHEVMAKP